MHFNRGALSPGASETLYGPPSTDPQVQQLVGLVNRLSVLVSSQIPAPGFTGRVAEGFQFSLGGRRGPHADGSHLGGVIATVTIDGDGTVVLERADRKMGDDDSELRWRQSCGDWYAIWGRSRDRLPQPGWGRAIEHSVVAGSTERLSLTLRFVREGRAAEAARERDGLWAEGDKCFAQYRAYSTGAEGVMSAGVVVKVNEKSLTCAIRFEDGCYDSSVSWRVMCRPQDQSSILAKRAAWERRLRASQKRKRTD